MNVNISMTKKLKKKIRDPDYQLWWEWGKGDLLIVDLFCIYHAVKGGFALGERIIDRVYEYELSIKPD